MWSKPKKKVKRRYGGDIGRIRQVGKDNKVGKDEKGVGPNSGPF